MTTARRIVLLLLVVSLIAGIATGGQIYYRISYLWLFLYFGSWLWSVMALKGVAFDRSARTLRAQVGQIFEERFDIQNELMIPRVWLEVHDESPLPGSEGSRVLTMIEGKQGRSYLARTRLIQRGVFPLGPTVLSSSDLFGLFPVKKVIPAHDSVLVYPMIVELDDYYNPPGLLPGGEALRRKTHQVTPNAAGVREYVHGDPLNRIHWLSTARRRHLMVKEFELDPLADLWLFLDAAEYVQAALPYQEPEHDIQDFWRHSVKITLPPATEEYAVSIAASLARNYLRQGRAVGLVAAGQQLTLLPPDRGGRQLGKILESLALLRAKGEVPLRGLVETQARHLMRGSTVVLITPSMHPEVVLVADHLLRRSLRPIVVLLDAATFGGRSGTDEMAAQIEMLGIPVMKVPCGSDLRYALSMNHR